MAGVERGMEKGFAGENAAAEARRGNG